MSPVPKPVDRVDTYEEFLEYARTGEKPVIYRLKKEEQTPCHEKWTIDFLEQLQIPVHFHRGTRPDFFNFQASPIELARIAVLRNSTVGELVKRRDKQGLNDNWEIISGTSTHFILENGPVEKWQELYKDCSDIEKILPDYLYRVGFWISCGKPGSKDQFLSSQLHWDFMGHHNLNYQIRGEKSILLYPPSDSQYLYPMPARFWHLSRIDPRKPADYFHPLLNNTHPILAELKEGDVLLIPARWWHHVTHKGDVNVNVTFWYRSKELSLLKWTWSSLLVPFPLEAWYFAAKVIMALTLFLPPMLLIERFETAGGNDEMHRSQRNNLLKRIGLAALLSAVALPVLTSRLL
jgi:hypothetical protein